VGWITGAIDSYLVRSGLAGPPGALGALALARQLVDEVHDSKLP
jgi:hypothetical protein